MCKYYCFKEQDEKMQLGFNIEKHTRASENREIVNQIKLLVSNTCACMHIYMQCCLVKYNYTHFSNALKSMKL